MSLTREEREELVNAIHAGTGFEGKMTFAEVCQRTHESLWSALCHTTGRCGRGYQPDDTSPEAVMYRLLMKAFSTQP